MAVNERLLRLLVSSRIEYELLPHREAFTAQDVAQTSHVAGRRLAKVVVARAMGGRYLMAVLPASYHLELGKLERLSRLEGLALASEHEIQPLFPDCEVGAMPPFGHLYNLPLYVDACLMEGENIVFQAGNHHEAIRMSLADYDRLARPFAAIECLHASAVAARS
jgi:Ala-tRNA(Pro) deacylase